MKSTTICAGLVMIHYWSSYLICFGPNKLGWVEIRFGSFIILIRLNVIQSVQLPVLL